MGYTSPPKKFILLERAFAHAIMQLIVRRGDYVQSNIGDNWKDLEAQGVIALDYLFNTCIKTRVQTNGKGKLRGSNDDIEASGDVVKAPSHVWSAQVPRRVE